MPKRISPKKRERIYLLMAEVQKHLDNMDTTVEAEDFCDAVSNLNALLVSTRYNMYVKDFYEELTVI